MKTDLTMIETRYLPPGCEHVQFPAEYLAELRRLERTGAVTVVGTKIRVGGTIYTTVRRHRTVSVPGPAPRWLGPVVVVGGAVIGAASVTMLVAWLVRTATSAVSQAGPALGFVVALSLVLLAVAAIRRRAGRTVTVVTTTRVRVK